MLFPVNGLADTSIQSKPTWVCTTMVCSTMLHWHPTERSILSYFSSFRQLHAKKVVFELALPSGTRSSLGSSPVPRWLLKHNSLGITISFIRAICQNKNSRRELTIEVSGSYWVNRRTHTVPELWRRRPMLVQFHVTSSVLCHHQHLYTAAGTASYLQLHCTRDNTASLQEIAKIGLKISKSQHWKNQHKFFPTNRFC